MAPNALIENFRRLANDFCRNPASFNLLAEQGGLLLAHAAQTDVLPDDFRALAPPAKYPPMTPPEQIGFARRTAWVMALTLAGKDGVLANPLRMKTISRGAGIAVSGSSAPDAELALSSARLCEYFADELDTKQATATTGAESKAAKPRKRRRRPESEPRPLTAKQLEAAQVVGEHKGNVTKAAKAIGVNPKTIRQHYNAGMKKLGKKAVKHGTRQAARDPRGQENLADGDDRRG